MIHIEKISEYSQILKIRELGTRTPEFAAGEEVIFWPLEVLTSWWKDSGGAMLVAIDQDRDIAGYALVTYHYSGIATFENLQVLSSWKGNGVGHRLIDAVGSDARAHGMEFVRTLFKEGNAPIASLFGKHGYSSKAPTVWFSKSSSTSSAERRSQLGSDVQARRLLKVDSEPLLQLINAGELVPWGLSGFPSGKDWIFAKTTSMVGLFRAQKLIAAGFATLHHPTRKATIESLFVSPGEDRKRSMLPVVLRLLHEIGGASISYVSAHPEEQQSGLIECLSSAGLKQNNIFIPYAKSIKPHP